MICLNERLRGPDHGFAIYLVTFASVALADCFCVFLVAIYLDQAAIV